MQPALKPSSQALRRAMLDRLPAVPLLVFLLFMLVIPVTGLLAQSLDGAALLGVWSNPYILERLAWTLLQAALSVLLTLLLGVPAAIHFARHEFPGRRALEALIGVPFVVPIIVAALGFLALFGVRGAVANLSDTAWLVLLANLFYNYGLVVRSVWASLEGMDRDLELVARLEGANAWQVFRFVTLPFALPAALSAAALVFLYCFASFGVPLLLGGSRYATLEVEIYQSLQRLDLGGAGALALLQLAITFPVTLLYTGLSARSSLTQEYNTNRRPARGEEQIWLFGHASFALLLTLSPLLTVIWRSVWQDGFTLEHYAAIFAISDTVFSSDALSSLWNNLRFAALALLIAVPLGASHAVAVWQSRSRALDALSLLPLMVSTTLLGVAYIVSYSTLAANLWLLIAAYAMSAYPFVTRAVLTGLRALDPAVLEAARTDGAGTWVLLRRIVVPLLSPNLRGGIGLAFAVIVGEFGATLVLQRPEWATLSTLIAGRLSRPGQLGEASALAVLLLGLTGLGLWVLAGLLWSRSHSK